MRIKRSGAIVILLENDQFVFHSFLARQTFSANPTALEILRRLSAWTDLEGLARLLPGYSRDSIRSSIRQLTELGAVIVEGSEAADLEGEFGEKWLWGPIAAAHHFTAGDGAFIAAEVGDSLLAQQVKFVPSPPLFTTNAGFPTCIDLPVREVYPEPFRTMARRRTNRLMRDEAISLEAIADCLLFSMAITAVMEDPDIVDLPLKMTPSGGGRNPYEGYVCVRNVEGLAPGTYHYSAMERTLGPLRTGPPPAFPALLAGQAWTESAAAVIFLVANFERSMWKYHHSAAYNIALIEAGHIGQNMMIAATHHGLVANPTAALSSDLAAATLGVGGVTQAVIYALALGVPSESPQTLPA